MTQLDAVLQKIEADIDGILKDAYSDGHQAGYLVGYNGGYQEGYEAAEFDFQVGQYAQPSEPEQDYDDDRCGDLACAYCYGYEVADEDDELLKAAEELGIDLSSVAFECDDPDCECKLSDDIFVEGNFEQALGGRDYDDLFLEEKVAVNLAALEGWAGEVDAALYELEANSDAAKLNDEIIANIFDIALDAIKKLTELSDAQAQEIKDLQADVQQIAEEQEADQVYLDAFAIRLANLEDQALAQGVKVTFDRLEDDNGF